MACDNCNCPDCKRYKALREATQRRGEAILKAIEAMGEESQANE